MYTHTRPTGRRASNPDSRVANMYVPVETLQKLDQVADRIGAGRGMAIAHLFSELERLGAKS